VPPGAGWRREVSHQGGQHLVSEVDGAPAMAQTKAVSACQDAAAAARTIAHPGEDLRHPSLLNCYARLGPSVPPARASTSISARNESASAVIGLRSTENGPSEATADSRSVWASPACPVISRAGKFGH
jgi:hypothetical protein